MGIEIKTKAKVIENGAAAVPANVFLGVLGSIKDEDVVLELKDKNLKVSSNKNSAVIKCMPHEDFPSIPKILATKTIKTDIKNFIHGFKSVWYSASTSNIKPELSSVYVYKDGEHLVFVSTDSFRLAEKKINIKNGIDIPQIIIPYKNVSEIIKLFEEHTEPVEILFDKNQIAFVSGDVYLVSRLVDGSFPDYKQIIPKNFVSEATVLKSDILNSIKASNIFSDSLNQVRIKADPKNGQLHIESKNNDIGEYKNSIKASASGESLELNFNNKYITDCMQTITSDSVSFSFAGQGKPLLIAGISDPSFRYIVMPMNR
jgi:DNA polymerase-3 subunit beta